MAHSGDAHAPLVVLLHDWPGAWFDYFWAIEPLAAAGFHAAALDFRGVGLSDKPPAGYDVRFAAGDVVAAIRALGYEDALVVGSGSGAAVAWAAAARYPEVVRGVVAVCGTWPGLQRRQLVWPRAIRRHPTQWAHAMTRRSSSADGVAVQRVSQLAEWRARHARVVPVVEKMAQWARVVSSGVPTRWAKPPVGQPVVLFTDGSPRWQRLARQAATLAPRLRVEEGTSRLPFVEDPEAFARTVATLT
ncbi:alpha/beta fold hydrolase [Corynebacterium sp. 13CS0277]|uniref:alpha/beta fold hydrolase n=1 Tax=Corynebacterium sp. 13CS0277 TaxID=2071994 RepID=UPI0013048BE1|nr:alpha/beta hydrolase [Corynebacterium sp. 13CS0277]